MARVELIDPRSSEDPEIREICDWVTEMEGDVPNHFLIEMNFPEFFKAKLGATKVLWQMGELSLPEIQHVGIAVSKANSCSYCTAAFCTIMNYGMETDEDYTKSFLENGVEVILDDRLKTIVNFALRVNKEMHDITDGEIAGLREVGLTDRGIVQLVNLVSDFASYNRLNLALQTDYDYRDMWRQVGFDWTLKEGDKEGDNTRGVRP
ncbi:hypothetical protein [Emcibacter sp.]|uniref:carboxymuconolactone decarboxylase family protein n=1 Tax=Emcibacter sp. TaxID=1979954 RepID=UPI002AA61EE9|nr:hypothetical protein [Emcibacter sp.]